MSKLSGVRKKMGRPRIDATPVNVRIPPNELAVVDAYIDAQPEPKPSRPDVMRLALRDWLAVRN